MYMMNPATGPQRGHIGKLREERKMSEAEAIESAAAQFDEGLTSEEAQDLIRRLNRLPKIREATTVSPGMYVYQGKPYKVKVSLSQGRPYAEELVVGLDGKGHFKYAAGVIRLLKPDMKMDLFQAAEFGREYGICCVCGRLLTNQESIEAGIGPICAGRL